MIEPSNSPWRAQVLVTTNDRHKRRMVVDYSHTINKHTELDAYPLPNLDLLANKIAEYTVYSTFDLKSVYHQVPICEVDRPYLLILHSNPVEGCTSLHVYPSE